MASIASRAECAHLTQGPATPMPRLWVVLGLTGTFMVLEAVGGWLSGSLALLADAGHMLTDVGALALSLLTAWIAQRPADANKTYGYLRWEILAALVNGAALFGIAGWVVVEAVAADPAPRAHPTGPVSGRRRGGPGGQPDQPGHAPWRRETEASTPGAPTSTSWATRSARSAPWPRPRSSGSPAGRWPTRSSRSPSSAAHPGRRLAAPPGEHRDPARRRSPARGHGRRAAPHPRRARRGGGARPARVDGRERGRGDERARRGAGAGLASRGAGRHPRRDGGPGYRARHDAARGGGRVRGSAGNRPRRGTARAHGTSTDRAEGRKDGRTAGAAARSFRPSVLPPSPSFLRPRPA